MIERSKLWTNYAKRLYPNSIPNTRIIHVQSVLNETPSKVNRHRRESQYEIQHNEDSFHVAIGPILYCVQLFSLFPVKNVMETDPRRLAFSICSFRFLYNFILLALGITETFIYTRMLVGKPFNIDAFGQMIFFVSCCLAGLLMVRMAINWKSIMVFWRDNEDIFLKHPYNKPTKWPLKRKLRVVCFTLLLITLVEHIFYVTATVDLAIFKVDHCKFNITAYEFVLRTAKRHLFPYIPNSIPSIFLCECIHIVMTLNGAFNDIFIVALSIGLCKRFDQITERLRVVKDLEEMPEGYWVKMREHYITACEIVRFVDGYLAPTIFLSVSNNLFFVCRQIFDAFIQTPVRLWLLYFVFSVLYLFSRIILILKFASLINDASIEPLNILRKIPKCAWCVETQRWTEQINYDCVALTGNKFFFLTRKLICVVVATILTYEVMLHQNIDSQKDSTYSCSL